MVQNIITFALLSACMLIGVSALREGRILDGQDTKNGQYPWVVSVRVNSVHTCVGTIITNKHILTAAHCVSEELVKPIDVKTVNVRVGSYNQFSGGRIVSVNRITINPLMASFSHDIAILKLDQPLQFTTKIQKLDFADADTVLDADSSIEVTGWGLLKPGGSSPFKLQSAKYTVYKPQLCELDVGFGYDWILCMKHKVGEGICTGDDGAGVIADNKVVGVVSFAFGACGTQFPDIATRVSYHSDWIKKTIEE